MKTTEHFRTLAGATGSAIVTDLVNIAMSVTNGDWDWENEKIPEVKHTWDSLRRAFEATLTKHRLLPNT